MKNRFSKYEKYFKKGDGKKYLFINSKLSVPEVVKDIGGDGFDEYIEIYVW